MMIHLYQFRFGETHEYFLCPPKYLINLETLQELRLNLFWVGYEGCNAVPVRDIYRMEFEVFQSLGWQKVVPAPSLEIPKRYQGKAVHVGYVMTAFIALIYASFPIYAHEFQM